MLDTSMKTLVRIAAILSFGSFLTGGLVLLGVAGFGQNPDAPIAVVVGLFFLGTAFFVGPMLLAAAERFGRKEEAPLPATPEQTARPSR